MPTITFWNTQNGSSGDEGENKLEALVTLSLNRDLIVLCEISGGTEGQWGAALAPDFSPVVPGVLIGQYAAGTTYRYVIVHRVGTPAPVSVHLIHTAESRPALYFSYLGIGWLAIHAPSVVGSTAAQKSALRTAFDTINANGLARPLLIFGDLNIDAQNMASRGNFINGTPGYEGVLPHYQAIWHGTNLSPVYTAAATRPKSGNTLDWLLRAAARPATVDIFDVEADLSSSLSSSSASLSVSGSSLSNSNGSLQSSGDMMCDGGSLVSSDEDWGGHITNMTDRSDHHAIDISW